MSETTPTPTDTAAADTAAADAVVELRQFAHGLREEMTEARPGEDPLLHAAQIAVGAASACWDNLGGADNVPGAGVFQDDRARIVADVLADVVDTMISERVRATRKGNAEELARGRAFTAMVADLDRNQNGRHERDVDAGDPTGVSQGNPLLPTGTVVGYDIRGDEYRMPAPGRRHDPAAWKVRAQ
jgi:hypothetical protein